MEIIDAKGSRHFSLPLGEVNGNAISRFAATLHKPRGLEDKDLDSLLRDKKQAEMRIADKKAIVASCDQEIGALDPKIAECESKIAKCDILLKKNRTALVQDARFNHMRVLERLQEARAAWVERRDIAARIQAGTEKILAALPHNEIQRLLQERAALEEVL